VYGRSLLQGNFTKNLSQNEKTFKRTKMLHDLKIGLQSNRGAKAIVLPELQKRRKISNILFKIQSRGWQR
jgi:hypothetical protein